MNIEKNLIEETLKIIIIRYSEFANEIASCKFEYRSDLKYKTAATDGKDIFIDPEYFASLDEEGRAFLLAHELMHKKFLHHLRIEKNGVKKDPEVWNEATDAVNNANLERDGFKIEEGYINRPEALHYSADEFYEILLKEKQENPNKKEYTHCDDHTLWEEVPKNTKEIPEIDERKEFAENRRIRMEKAKENYERMKEEILKKESSSEEVKVGDIGESTSPIDWKILVRREFDKQESFWSRRRSIEENNYAYRLEEIDREDEAETEVLIDISGSVSLDLVRAFLRNLKPLIKESKLKVGCFNEKFWGMVEIKSVRDIDQFVLPKGSDVGAWTEDWDLAVRSFSKKREVNKFIFTDGYPGPGNMPKEDLKNENVIWLVYGNKNFKPCCGKVILITKEQLSKMQLSKREEEIESKRR